MAPGRAACGDKIKTAWVERLHRDRRQRGAAGGRRVHTRCQGQDDFQEQLGLFQGAHPFVLPPASCRPALAEPIPTQGSGAAKGWRPGTPAMAAGLTEHVWPRKEGRRVRGPPGPHPHAV